MIEISELKPEEIPAAASAFATFYSEGGIPGKFDSAAATSYWLDAHAVGRAVMLVAKEGEKMVGIIMGVLSPDLYTGETTAYECVWCVLPEYTGVGLRLYRKWEKECRAKGAVIFIAGHLPKWQCLNMASLYKRLGYQPHEVTYIKRTTERH
jgi:hypothetical protein